MTLLSIDRVLGTRPRWQVVACALLLVALFGVADHGTGFEISFSVFYLLPIMLAAWYAGEAAGLVVCALAAMTWLAVDFTAGNQYSQAWIAYWNAFTRLAIFVAVAWLLARLKRNLERQRGLIAIDALTGVKSLRAFEEDAALLLALAARNSQPVALGFIDVDGFKSLNDSRGHAEGDRALARVGAELNLHIRFSDIAARIGGDEFVVLLPNADRKGAEAFFTRLHTRLLAAMKEEGWPIGFSIGLAVFVDAGIGVKTALERADALMYTAKKTRRNSIVCEVFNTTGGGHDGDARAPSRRGEQHE